MKLLRNSFSCLLTLTTCAIVFYSVAKLILFLSTPVKYSLSVTWFYNLLDNREKFKEILTVLGFDTVLIIGFILSHSLCKTQYVKNVWKEYGLGDWQRSTYNLISSSALLVRLWAFLGSGSVVNQYTCTISVPDHPLETPDRHLSMGSGRVRLQDHLLDLQHNSRTLLGYDLLRIDPDGPA